MVSYWTALQCFKLVFFFNRFSSKGKIWVYFWINKFIGVIFKITLSNIPCLLLSLKLYIQQTHNSIYANVLYIEYYRCIIICIWNCIRKLYTLYFSTLYYWITLMHVDTPFTLKKYYVYIKYNTYYVHK